MKRSCILGLLLAVAAPAHGTDWPRFRGPFFNGSTDETNLPTKWSDTENIAWTAPLPGPSAATPIVSGDRVFIASTDPAAGNLKAICLDRKTGKLLWQHVAAEGLRRDQRSNFASATPAADGKVVIFFYSNGELLAYSFSGKKLWERNIQKDFGEFAFQWTFSASPLLCEGRLYIQVLQRDVPVGGHGLKDRKNESYILALKPQTGKTLWRHIRPSDAVAESRESFTTPAPFEYRGRKSILVIGGDVLTAHDPASGKELWRWGTWNPRRIEHWRHVPSPVGGKGIVLVCAPKRDPVYAIKAGRSGRLGSDAVAWISRDHKEISSDVPTPAFYDGDFFILSDVRKAISRVEPATGKIKWSVSTPGRPKYEASPLAAGGKIYIINFEGQVTIVNAQDGSIVNTIPMETTGEYPIRSSISASGGQLFIRLNRKLVCAGKAAAKKP